MSEHLEAMQEALLQARSNLLLIFQKKSAPQLQYHKRLIHMVSDLDTFLKFHLLNIAALFLCDKITSFIFLVNVFSSVKRACFTNCCVIVEPPCAAPLFRMSLIADRIMEVSTIP
jgi:hypothetical protein